MPPRRIIVAPPPKQPLQRQPVKPKPNPNLLVVTTQVTKPEVLIDEPEVVTNFPPQQVQALQDAALAEEKDEEERAPALVPIVVNLDPLQERVPDDPRSSKRLILVHTEEETAKREMEKAVDLITFTPEELKIEPGEAVIAILKTMPKHDFKPREKTRLATKNGKCIFITSPKLKNIAWTPRTVSWCMLIPGKDQCEEKLTFCFQVDEVRDWIFANAHDIVIEQKGSDVKTLEQHCPMFEVEQLRGILLKSNIRDVEIPDEMTIAFRTVIENFEVLSTTTTTQEANEGITDHVTKVVTDGMRDYLERTLKSTEASAGETVLGSFWRNTKNAMTKFALQGAKFVIWLLENPFYLMLITAAAKFVRLVLCAYLSFNKLGDQVIDQLFAKLTGEIAGFGGGIPRWILNMSRAALKCAARTLSGQAGSALIECVGNTVYETGRLAALAAQDLAAPVLKVLESVTKFGLGYFDKGYLTDVFKMLGNTPFDTITAITNPDLNIATAAANRAAISLVVHGWEKIADWESGVLLFIIQKLPDKVLWSLIGFVYPPAMPFLYRYRDYNPLVILKKLFVYANTFHLVMEALEEIREWIFDLGRCIWNTAVKKFMYFFGRGTIEDANPDLAVTCCLTGMIVAIQQMILDNPALRARKDYKYVTDTVESVKAGVGSAVSGAVGFAGRQVETLGSGMANGISYFGSLFSSASTFNMEAEPDITNRWIMGNTNDSTQVGKQSVFTLDVDGRKFPFYVFLSPPDNVYHTGFKAFISLRFDEVQKNFPNAVWTYQNRNFVVLQALPKSIVHHLLLFQTPVVNMNSYMP